jgi:hypothetical protein
VFADCSTDGEADVKGVMPAKAGIQVYQGFDYRLDSGVRRNEIGDRIAVEIRPAAQRFR